MWNLHRDLPMDHGLILDRRRMPQWMDGWVDIRNRPDSLSRISNRLPR